MFGAACHWQPAAEALAAVAVTVAVTVAVAVTVVVAVAVMVTVAVAVTAAEVVTVTVTVTVAVAVMVTVAVAVTAHVGGWGGRRLQAERMAVSRYVGTGVTVPCFQDGFTMCGSERQSRGASCATDGGELGSQPAAPSVNGCTKGEQGDNTGT